MSNKFEDKQKFRLKEDASEHEKGQMGILEAQATGVIGIRMMTSGGYIVLREEQAEVVDE